jgi:phospholipase C
MILTLPADHTEGMNPGFPTPRAMVADNDLALGRVVEAVTNSPQWKETAIFVMEDDAQAGPDHVDGHRTVCLAISPYTRRGYLDSSMYTQVSVLRSIELMLGLDPMTKFDATAIPFTACFTDTPDTTPYRSVPNRIPLDEMNRPLRALKGKELYWAKQSMSLDWSGVDTAEWNVLNRVVWFSVHGDKPYPDRRAGTE